MTDWSFDAWEPLSRGSKFDRFESKSPYDEIDFHVDLGCGTIKKGRIGIDRYPAPGVNVVVDLDALQGLPFDDGSIRSIISHHCFEHIGHGFISLMDEIYRVLEPGGILRAITPLFPSRTAVEDPDHKRYFMEQTFESFCGHLGTADNPTGSWMDSFSVPYTKARFEMLEKIMTPPVPTEEMWGPNDVREIRVAMRAVKA